MWGCGLHLKVDGDEDQSMKQRCHACLWGQGPGPGSVVESVKDDEEHFGVTSSKGLLWVLLLSPGAGRGG